MVNSRALDERRQVFVWIGRCVAALSQGRLVQLRWPGGEAIIKQTQR
ncbi:hypothetical protein SAMN05443245_5484 [Paraburkholderia fungorum]|uniref:Uncharacterized protein n=1 Tax=Paraburkholderia fungorum TaxID=134537 RepID=A0A1H1IQ45_9BURK|nr:hypothetical protein SAMN05443245_5484 [Paraburkholderia fungorum]